MKRLFAIAAILLATTAAKAGDSYTFDVGGRTIHIEAPSNCRSTDCVSVSVPGVYESGPKRSKLVKAKADREREQEAREYLQDREDNQGKVAIPATPAARPHRCSHTSHPGTSNRQGRDTRDAGASDASPHSCPCSSAGSCRGTNS